MFLDGMPNPTLQRIVLEKVRIAASAALDKDRLAASAALDKDRLAFCRNELEVQSEIDHFAQGIVVNLYSAILGHKESTTETNPTASVPVPADWWQAVRERWFPKWWLRRWPVKWTVIKTSVTVTTTHWHLCPHANIKAKESHIDWLVQGEHTNASAYNRRGVAHS